MEAAAVLARLAQYLGAALAFGWPCAARLVGASPPKTWLTLAGALLVALGAAVSLGAQTAAMVGADEAAFRSDELWLVLSGTAFGHGLAARLGLAEALLLAIVFSAPAGFRVALGALVAASMALTGHAAAGEGATGLVHQAADAVHMLAAALWTGALLAFVSAAFAASSETRAAGVQAALARFSGLGSALVAALILTGLVNSAVLVTPAGIPALSGSEYGRWLLVKLGLFGLMLGLAAANRFVLTPGLLANIRQGAHPRTALRKLRLSLTVEAALGVAVLFTVAVFGRLPPVVETLAQ